MDYLLFILDLLNSITTMQSTQVEQFLHLASNTLTLLSADLMEIMLKQEDLNYMEFSQITKCLLLILIFKILLQ